MTNQQDTGVAPSSRSRACAPSGLSLASESQAEPLVPNAEWAICPRCSGWGSVFNEADEIYVGCGACAQTGRTIPGSARELAHELRGLLVPGGPDRVRLPSGAWLEGEGAEAYCALVRAFISLLERWSAPAQAIEAQRAATAKTGAVEDESAVPEGNAPNLSEQGARHD